MTAPRSVLIYPPITDPTSGYHSLSYIDSYARAQGHPAADMIDANIEAFHYSYSDKGVEWLERELSRRGPIDFGPYVPNDAIAQAHLMRVADPDPEAVRRAVAVFQDPQRFYDYGQYQDAVEATTAWMNSLGRIGFPGQFRDGFHLQLPPLLGIGSIPALTDPAALRRLSMPFQAYYDDMLIPRLIQGRYDVVGLNITYSWQLPFALWLAKLIRSALPDAFVIAGGTEVSDTWKHVAKPEYTFQVFADLDAIVVGEGETAYASILSARAAGTLPTSHPNVRLHPRYGARRPLPLHYEVLREIPTPDFRRLPWDQYLSPERFVYYAPTRGCYWNKCTFCDYGLNTDGPTSPWRQDTVDLMMRDVRELSKFAKFIYFSVDVLAPATILRFAEAVVDAGLDIRWGAEIRLEKYWSAERCELLKRAGCTAVSVGFESANQRILDLIDKGTKTPQVLQTITAMSEAGIGVQMMGFTGFPTETRDEAMETIDFLVEHRDKWTFGGLGDFVLTPGAIVAKDPQRFGLTNVRPPEGADIARHLFYDEPITEAVRDEVTAAKAVLAAHYDRPWLGSIDTPHTFFYHDRYGTAVRDLVEADRTLRAADNDVEFVVNGAFIDRPDEQTLAMYYRLYGLGHREPPKNRIPFRRADGTIVMLPKAARSLLALFDEPVTIGQAGERMWLLGESAPRVWGSLIRQRLIRRITAH